MSSLALLPLQVTDEPLMPSLSPAMLAPKCLDDMESELAAVEALVIPTYDYESEPDNTARGDAVDHAATPCVSTAATTPVRTPSPTMPPLSGSPTAYTALLQSTPSSDPSATPTSPSTSNAVVLTPVRRGCQTMLEFVKGQDTQTPTKGSTDVVYDLGCVKDVSLIIADELGNDIPEVKVPWVRRSYRQVASDAQIMDFLETSEHYSYEDKRWVDLPEVAESEGVLYDPFCRIINSILEAFGLSGLMGSVRKAIDTHRKQLKHRGLKPINKHHSSPDISVRGSGPSFIHPLGNAGIGFENMVGFFDAKRDREVDLKEKHIVQFGTYTRQVFIHQPNRRYVRSMAITERRARVYHFDRSGAQYTELFDIHADPDLFVRIVLGICTIDERLLGLDDTVQYTVGPNGLRTGGYLRTVGPDQAPVTYTLLVNERPWSRSGLRGRGIVCWPVKNEKGERLIVKDYWMAEGRTPEYELLEDIKDVPGVCQMVSYEVAREQTKDFRGSTRKFSKDAFHNSIAIRLTLKAYGTSIDNFTSPEEMLAALRDAIAAHKVVVSRGLFHRDICHNNVLIGPQGVQSRIGERGILMDFDMAIGPLTGKVTSDHSKGFKSGILFFQSTIIAKAMQRKESIKFPAHDHLDELEAFYWLFCFLVLTHNPTGGQGPKNLFHDVVKEMMDPKQSQRAKSDFIKSEFLSDEVETDMYEGWRDICTDLLLDWTKITVAAYTKKAKLLYRKSEPLEDGTVPNRFSNVLDDVPGTYGRILGLLDDALNKAFAKSSISIRPPRVFLPRTRSLRSLKDTSKKGTEATESGSSKVRAREPENHEERPTQPKRACPPSRAPGPSTLSRFIPVDDD